MKVRFMILFIVVLIAATKYVITPLSDYYAENKVEKKIILN